MSPDLARRRAGSRLMRIIWPFVAIVALLLLLASASLSVMSALRAYVGGESAWSKAQKSAVDALDRYVRTRDDADFTAYRTAMTVVFGDREARLDLEADEPDEGRVRGALAAGRNHPDDIPAMMWLYRHFRRAPFMTRAVEYWGDADALAVELNDVAYALRAAVALGEPAPLIAPLIARVHEIDARLTPLEEGFSATMAAASRHTAIFLTA